MADLSGIENEIVDLPEPPPINRTLFFQQKSPETLRKEFLKIRLALQFKKTLLAMNSQDRYFILMKMLELLHAMPQDSNTVTLSWVQTLLQLNSTETLTNNIFAWDTLYSTVCYNKAFKTIAKLLCLDTEN